MRNLKKFLALVLAMMMAFSMVLTASATSIDKNGNAQSFNDTNGVEFLTAIEVLNGMNVLKGDANPSTGEPTGNFRPTDTITRAEVAALVYRLATGDVTTNAEVYAQYGNFSDVRDDAWYAGYVGYCANAGYIKGYAGEYGPFGPTDNVTGYQALAMILRAVGYGVNGEFEGGSWQLNVASIGNQRKVLDGINKTHFKDTLQQPAQRQVVAEIFFQAAQINRVVYTPAFGYESTNMAAGGGTSTSLGVANFGLTNTKRIVVGNQATGESATVLGPVTGDTIAYKDDSNADATVSYTEYGYPGSILVHDDVSKGNKVDFNGDEIVVLPASLGLKVDLQSGLNLFGHKIDLWYNANTNHAYAYYDLATNTALVRASGAGVSMFETDPYYNSDDTEEDNVLSLGKAAQGKDFVVNPNTYIATSDRYGRINDRPGQQAAAVPTRGDTGADAVRDEAGVTENTNNSRLYMLVSNSRNKELDVVITLEAELARITMQDTTARAHTLSLGWPNAAADGVTYVDSKLGHINVDTNEMGNGVLYQDSLTATSEKALGSLVTAWTIKGTNYDYDCRQTNPIGTYAVNEDLYFYQLNKITATKTGTVSTYDPKSGRVTLVEGGSIDFTQLPIVDGAVPTPDNDLYFYNGVQYTFYLDELGQYVRAEQGVGYQFLYGTYADYKVGDLGTGTIDYVVTGVNWNGEKVLIQPVETLDTVRITGALYETELAIAKKNLGGATSDSADRGNEQKSGVYTGYAYNPGTKDLATDPDSVAANSPYGGEVHNPENYRSGQIAMTGSANSVPNATPVPSNETVWQVTKTDAANGWADVEGDTTVGSLLVTPNTKFIVVSGTGSASLNVDIYNGMTEFLRGSDSVTIDVGGSVDSPALNAYFKILADQYNNIDTTWATAGTSENWMIDTVIVPKAAVSWSGNNSLYFSTTLDSGNGFYGGDGSLLANTIMEDHIFRYTVYQNGEKTSVWVDVGADGSGAPLGVDEDQGNFYVLTEAGTLNGVTIYTAEVVTHAGAAVRGNINDTIYTGGNPLANCESTASLGYQYFATNNTSTARIGGQVYNVSNAKVVNLSGKSLSLGSVTELNNAISMGYTIDNVAILNNGVNVSVIYVVDVNGGPYNPGT